MEKPLAFVDTHRMVEYSMATDKGFQFGSIHGPAWVPIALGIVGAVVLWQVVASFMKPSR
jgi:hypothetical protein